MASRRLRRTAKIVLFVFAGLVLLLSVGITLTIGWRPIIGARARNLTNRKFDPSPERLARGKYLVGGVAGCFACHSPEDQSKRGYPPVDGKIGGGGQWFDPDLNWLVVPNITPDKETGAGYWTDDMLARAIREGIGHDGRALFPIMPYESYRTMSDEDLASIIVYLRTIPPVKNALPQSKPPFPLSRLIQGVPQPISNEVAAPDATTPSNRGKYLATIGACADCHTPQVKGQRMADMDLAGGFSFKTPEGTIASYNITPDVSGISYYDEALFINVMRTGKVGTRDLNSRMPWYHYKNMTDDDLKSIFAYLKTIKPVKHRVDNTLTATDCRKCKLKHGGGENN